MASSCVWLLLGFCASSVHGHLESEAVFPSSFHGFCKVKRDGLYEVAPHSRKFIVCVNGVLTLRLCPLQEMFDAISGHCIPKALGPAVDLALKCRHLRDGFYSAKEQCRPYYIVCFNNEGKVKRCERGEVFDSVSGFCKEPKFGRQIWRWVHFKPAIREFFSGWMQSRKGRGMRSIDISTRW